MSHELQITWANKNGEFTAKTICNTLERERGKKKRRGANFRCSHGWASACNSFCVPVMWSKISLAFYINSAKLVSAHNFEKCFDIFFFRSQSGQDHPLHRESIFQLETSDTMSAVWICVEKKMKSQYSLNRGVHMCSVNNAVDDNNKIIFDSKLFTI